MDYEHFCRIRKSGFKGRRIFSPPFVLMDGLGISSTYEWLSIKECCRALYSSGLMSGNRWGLFVRILFLYCTKNFDSIEIT